VTSRARDAGRVARRGEILRERLRTWGRGEREGDLSPETLALDKVADEQLIAAVRRLARPHRSVIALRFGAQLTSPEIARLLGTSRMAVVKTTRRALDRLRHDMEATRP